MNHETIRERARLLIEQRQDEWEGQRPLTVAEIGRLMAEHLVKDLAKQSPEDRNYAERQTGKMLRRMLGTEKEGGELRPPTKWDPLYMSALEKVLGVPRGYLEGESRLPNVSDHGWGAMFGRILDRSILRAADIRILRDQLREAADRPALFSLIVRLMRAIVGAKNKEEAFGSVNQLIGKVPDEAFTPPSSDRQSRRRKSSPKP